MFVILVEFTFEYFFDRKFFGDNILEVKSKKKYVKDFYMRNTITNGVFGIYMLDKIGEYM